MKVARLHLLTLICVIYFMRPPHAYIPPRSVFRRVVLARPQWFASIYVQIWQPHLEEGSDGGGGEG
jgi:hypothetical protein